MDAGKKKGGEGEKKKAMDMPIGKDIMKMLGGFTVLRMTSLMGMLNISFTKEELLKLNKQLNRIRKPKDLK